MIFSYSSPSRLGHGELTFVKVDVSVFLASLTICHKCDQRTAMGLENTNDFTTKLFLILHTNTIKLVKLTNRTKLSFNHFHLSNSLSYALYICTLRAKVRNIFCCPKWLILFDLRSMPDWHCQNDCCILLHCVAFCSAFCNTRRKSIRSKGLRQKWPARFALSLYPTTTYVAWIKTCSLTVRLVTDTIQFLPLPSSRMIELMMPTCTLPLVSTTLPYLPVRMAERILSRLFICIPYSLF